MSREKFLALLGGVQGVGQSLIRNVAGNPALCEILCVLAEKRSELTETIPPLLECYEALANCFERNGTLYLCGNGGSHADCLHMSAELMKAYERKRNLTPEDRQRFAGLPLGDELAGKLEYGFSTIVLGLNHSLSSAFANDVDPDMVHAQHLWAVSRAGASNNVFMGISTSGKALNVRYVATVAKARGMKVISLTGPDGDGLAAQADIAIKVPGATTAEIQENGVPVYHALCRMIEARYFSQEA